MSNFDAEQTLTSLNASAPCAAVEVLEAREVPLGGIRAMNVYRTLPQKQRSFVGSWCFLDHYGPDNVAETGGMQVPRHPHTGLATVSWLFSGRIEHLDSAGNIATVLPGELNLMVAGRGITHQELNGPSSPELHGVQLWYALPEYARFSDNAFVHYRPEPVQLTGATAKVFIGELCESRSPVATRTAELLGAEILLEPHATLQLSVRPDFEHGVLAEHAAVTLNGVQVTHRNLGFVAAGSTSLTITNGAHPGRVLLLGGIPFREEIVMWWNFIGRNHDEIIEFRRRYQAELGFEPVDPADVGKEPLFGSFPAGTPAPLPAPTTPLARLKPRK